MCASAKPKSQKTNRQKRAETINLEAHAKWEAGEFRAAFLLMRKAADLGACGSRNTLGYMYDLGIGVKKSRDAALYWYRRGVRAGDSGAAANIGTIYRDELKTSLALRWFRKAVALGDIDANLEVAKILLNGLEDPDTAAHHLMLVLKGVGGEEVTIASQELAAALLMKMKRK